MDKRKYSRVVFETKALISFNNNIIEGKVENLSMKGAYIKTKTPVNLLTGDEVNLKLNLTGTTSKLDLNLKSTIKRVDSDGFGIEFTSIDLDSFTHLKNIIAYN
ncbi:MAG: PilZ domain-containing protein, partial [Bacillota bacterium]|nr:PilZ domain-containing protein [Bacillota bacterium]